MTAPVVLVVLDGFGLGEGGAGDATALARTPFFDELDRDCAHSKIETSGRAVGLPDGQMGNSEVGHMTLGAGRVIDHDIVRIQKAVDAGELASRPALAEVLGAAERAGGDLHLLGLVSDGGVHSSLGHLDGLISLAIERGLKPWLHVFGDGRDTPPRSALRWVPQLEARLREAGGGIASVCGRYWAMDRDQRWDRVARAYRALVLREGETATSGVDAVERAYARDEGDEFIAPTVIEAAPGISDGCAALFFNFRADRARELTNAITRVAPDALGDEIRALPAVSPARFASMTVYSEALDVPSVFEPIDIRHTLGELIAGQGIPQLRIAETEKYAHVTYFFNGGLEQPLAGEERILIPSPRDVATYDQKPAMSAVAVTDALLAALERTPFGFVLVNYANPDMVGHTGVIPAGVEAVQVVDACLQRLCEAVRKRGGSLLITADHGNIEQLIDPETQGPHTAHTTNPVPLWWVRPPGSAAGALADGGLADLAPTVCELLELVPAAEMSGQSLLR